jgi:hypothetical protein
VLWSTHYHQEIKQIQETVGAFSNLSRRELSQTICEHLNWYTAAGVNKVDACMKMLEKLEDLKVLKLPAKRVTGKKNGVFSQFYWRPLLIRNFTMGHAIRLPIGNILA